MKNVNPKIQIGLIRDMFCIKKIADLLCCQKSLAGDTRNLCRVQIFHTASLLAKNGASPKDLQSLLGHSDSYTSIQIYTHSYKEVQRKNTMLLDQEIFEKGSEVG